MEEEVRLQKYLASKGIASRRRCEQYIEEGLVEVNGEKVFTLGTKINPQKDIINFKGRKIENREEDFVYILLNKPIRICDNCKRPI
jgi:16S rRNA U516 pseudouridylate synthase RsuA-like enzyme